MNCLLLLFILFCCNGNCNSGNCRSVNCNSRVCRGEDYNNGKRSSENCNSGGYGREYSNESKCDIGAPPPMQRTQFPYLDVEPRTCGCEEKAES